MATRVPGYALAVKIGDKIIAGLITTGFKEKPNYEEVLHKEHAGVPDEDIEDSARELSCSGQTYRRTPGEADAYEDYETIREAAAAGSDIAFSYHNAQTEEYISGVGKIIDFGEDANSKDTGTYSFTIKEVTSLETGNSSLILFSGDTFDFTSNVWLDKSGNGNNFSLREASARTGNGANLDYTITGLLTSDTIEVESGSATPTIPVNGTLRIGAAQIVYGVTIRRSGAVWAIIPFCEPIVSGNLPTRSFDVSGNGRHASCATIAAGNITTQNNYFYLQRYGYNLGSENVLGWNVSSWTGDHNNYTAIFAGVTLGDTQSANAFLQPTPDGLGCRYTRNASYNLRLRRFTAMTSGKTYRFTVRLENYSSGGASGGFQIGNLGITAANKNHLIANGNFDLRRASTNTTFEMGASNTAANTVVDFYSPELRLLEIVPALLSGINDAVGRPLEFIPDGKTLLKYGGKLQAPSTLIAADQKGCWSDYINQGYLVSGKTYLIEKTEADHFGLGLIEFDEFISAGTEWCDDNNVVRELMLNSAQRGFFFDDNTTPHPRGYDDFKSIRPHFCYCKRPKTKESHTYYYPKPAIYPPYLNNAIGFGWKGYIENDQISDLVVLKPTAYLTDQQKIIFNASFSPPEGSDFALFSIIFDSIEAAQLSSIVSAFESRRVKLTRALYFSDTITKENNDSVLRDAGHEVIAHTPSFGATLPGYKDFHETAANYTTAELQTYYNNVKEYMTSQGYGPDHKVYPGGAYDEVTQEVNPLVFKTGFLANGSEQINLTPFIMECHLGRYENDLVDSAALSAAQAMVDSAITNKGWLVLYTHNYSWSGSSLANLGTLLNYIASRITAGQAIRFAKIGDAFNIIKRIK